MATALLSLVAFNASAGKLVIENGNNKVSISAGENNSLSINGNSVAMNKKVYSYDGKLVGNLLAFTLTNNQMTPNNIESGQYGEHLQFQFDTLSTVGITVKGKEYAVNLNSWNHIPSSIMFYTDSACTQAKYVLGGSIPSGAWIANTIVADSHSEGAFVTNPFATEDEEDAVNNETLYTFEGSSNSCIAVTKNADADENSDGAYGFFELQPLSPLPEGVVRSDDHSNSYGKHFEHRLESAKAPLSIK
ncbi:hypothetical protein [Photobacterium kishitanii]|uniref:hypothetical protein n=1 Tax=Photobacterium kishitanii TaxID=318456 RepID=UPI0011B20190|nr:hypothetical protein [Photobacterium kishitanii]